MMKNLKNTLEDPRVRLIIGIGASLLLCLFVFHTASVWRADWRLAHEALPEAAIAPDQTNELVEALPSAHLFGQSLTDSDQMPITNLQLLVTGIVKIEGGQSGTISKAYISMKGEPSKIYQVGDMLPYGVKVYEITSDTVILENEGHFERLPLPRETLQFKARTQEERW